MTEQLVQTDPHDGDFPPCQDKTDRDFEFCDHFDGGDRQGDCGKAGRPPHCTEWVNQKRAEARAEDRGKVALPLLPQRPLVTAPPPKAPAEPAASPQAQVAASEGSENQTQAAPPAKAPKAVEGPPGSPALNRPPPQVGGVTLDLSAKDLADMARFGLEVRIQDPTMGTLWLVPKLTGKQRPEVTFALLLTLRRIMDLFPGATVKEFVLAELRISS